MNTPKFRLRPDYISKEGKQAIYLFVKKEGKRFRYSTGLEIKKEYWNNEKQRPKTTVSELRNYPEYNGQLLLTLKIIDNEISKLTSIVTGIGNKWKTDNIDFDPKKLQIELDIQYKKQAPTNKKIREVENFETYLQTFIDGITSGKIVKHKNHLRYSPATIKAYNNLKYRLDLYKKDRKVTELNYSTFNTDWLTDYSKYELSKGKQQSSINNTIKNLKSVLNRAKEQGYHNEKGFESKNFQKVKVDTTKVALSLGDLKAIESVDLEAFPHFEKYRDVFLVGCYTGLRFSDLTNIKPHNITENEEGKHFIDIVTKKTNQICIIPMRPIVRQILSKYNNRLPSVTEQKVNANIKKIAQLAGIEELIENKTIVNGVQTVELKPKYKMITTHTGRRTAITLMYLAKIPTNDIMKISGHKTESQFLAYVKSSEKETASRLSDHPFFQ